MILTKQLGRNQATRIRNRLMYSFIRILGKSLSYTIEDSLISLKHINGLYTYTCIWMEDEQKIGVSVFENSYEGNIMRLCLIKGDRPEVRISISNINILNNAHHFYIIEHLFLILFPNFTRDEFYSWECDCNIDELISIIQKHKG